MWYRASGLVTRGNSPNIFQPSREPVRRLPILRRKKDGDWYIYPQFLASQSLNNVHKNVQKSYKILKASIHNVLSTETNIVRICLSLCLTGCVRFARYCGKM